METTNTITSEPDAFIRELLVTARTVLVGPTEAVRERLDAIPAVRLLGAQFILAFALGIQTFDPRKMIGYPVFLGALTLIWVLLFALVSELKRDQLPALYAYFLGTSLFLLPAVVPLVGPWFLQALVLGWPFVLARVLAAHLGRPPGKVLLDLILPPLILWLTIQAALWIVGRAFFSLEISA